LVGVGNVQEEIGTLDVAMQDFVIVRECQCIGKLREHFDSLTKSQSAASFHERFESNALIEIENYIRSTRCGGAEVQRSGDVGMLKSANRFGLSLKCNQLFRADRRKNLDDNLLVQDQVLAKIVGACLTCGERLDDFVAFCWKGTRICRARTSV